MTALFVRTSFTNQQAWNDLVAWILVTQTEGLLQDLQIEDRPDRRGCTAEQLWQEIPEETDYLYVAIADDTSLVPDLRPQDRPLLIVGVVDEERGRTFRTTVSEWVSVDANLAVGNASFSDFADQVDGAGPPLYDWRSTLEERPQLSELARGKTLRQGSVSSPSGAFVFVNQDDGNLVIYRVQDGTPVWSSGTLLENVLRGLSHRLVLLETGNLVLYQPTGAPMWSTGTDGHDVRRAVITEVGALALVDSDGRQVWSSTD